TRSMLVATGMSYREHPAPGVAEHTGADGKELLTAYILGVEASARLGAVAKGAFHQVGFHPTGLIGAFGCTLLAGLLMGANARQLAMAQGIALSTGSGSLEFLEDGAWTKRMHPGWAGIAGITGAALARQGFIGPERPYEGRFGLYASHLGEWAAGCDYSLATAGLGESWEIDRVGIKPFPACHFAHGCADSALALTREHGLTAADVEKVTVLVPREVIKTICEPVEKKRRPVSDYDAKFSVQFIVAAAIARGRFGLAELEHEALADPEILALVDRVTYEVDPDSAFPEAYSGGVVLTTRAGQELSHHERINRGAADRPLGEGEIIDKFMENAAMAVAPTRAEAIKAAVLGMDRGATAADLAAVLGGK
ncbi:MAG: MmgE/PrpD family protein, partial [bacterium]